MSEAPPDSTDIPRPHLNTYWVEPIRLLAGEYPFAVDHTKGQAKLATYLAAGINTFIDLTEPNELYDYAPHLPPGVEHRRFPVRDLSVPRDARYMTRILDAIDEALAAGRRVYVHCWGGVGRTGTVVACWLQRHGCGAEEALHEIAQHWTTVEKSHRVRRSPETNEQVAWVLNWPQLLAALEAQPENHP